MAVALLCGFAFVACSKDDNPKDDPKEETQQVLYYSVKLNDVWIQFCDVEISYMDLKGDMQTEKITSSDWEKTLNTEGDKLLDAKMVLKSKVKADHPEIDATATYEISKSVVGYTAVITRSGAKSMKTLGGIASTLKVSGARLLEYFARNKEDVYTAN